MNQIFYDSKTECWHHYEKGRMFGKSQLKAGTEHSFSFSIRQQNERLGPLVGILTSGTPKGKLCGDFTRFASIQTALQRQGGISFVFSPYGLQEEHIEGYVWLSEKRWYKCRFPYPDVVYNRVPYRKHEQRLETKRVIEQLTNLDIPLFNPCFFPKWESYQAFSANEALRPYLLETKLLQTEEDLWNMLHSHKEIYVKQSEAAKGKHIFFLRLLDDNLVLQKDLQDERTQSVSHIWDFLSRQQKPYIGQRAIVSAMQNGRKYDLRIAAHALSGTFCISGIGVRLAKEGHIVTHVPHGGEIIAKEKLHRPVRYDIVKMLAEQCGQSLCSRFGRVREFSLDIGVDESGHYYIFEANSKPMVFDEPHVHTETLHNLLDVFTAEAGFSKRMP